MPTIPYLKDRFKKKYKPKPRDPNSDKKRKQRQAGYQDPHYIKIRELKRMNNPCCEICAMNGIVNWGEHVHHWRTFVVPDKQKSRELLLDYDNLLMCCRRHHDMLHVGLLKNCYSLQDVANRQYELKNDFGIDIYDVRDFTD